jgi:asparagine synthase (glutamine-hydrolysing)
MAAIEPAADRAFLANCLFDLYGLLSYGMCRSDRVGMAASTEIRLPFLANELFDFSIHLPRHAKLHGKWTKWIVRQAALAVLPAAVVYGRKRPFPMPDVFSSGTERLLLGGLLVEQMRWSRAMSEEIVASLANDAELRYQLVGFEMWLQIFFDNVQPQEMAERIMALSAESGGVSAHGRG